MQGVPTGPTDARVRPVHHQDRGRPITKVAPQDRHTIKADGCDREPPEGLLRGLAQRIAGEYWACHETLEEIWAEEPGDIRYLYQGILLVAVGLLHLERRNRHGALVKLRSGLELLAPFAPRCMGVDVDGLRSGAQEILTVLERDEGALDEALRRPRPVCRWG